jgi:putative peptidoglycan lipid II flippase
MVQWVALRAAMSDDASVSPASAPPSPLKLTASIATLAGLNIVATFGYQWLPIVKLGVGAATDALFFSAIVPQIVLSVVSSGLTSVLTPLLSTADADAFRRKAWTFAHGVAFGALAINGLLFLLAPVWVRWLVPGFDPSTQALTIELVRIQLIAAVFTALLTVNWSAQFARNRFLWVEASAVIAGAVGLVVLWIAIPIMGVHGVAWALALRAALQVFLLLPGLGAYTPPDWRGSAGRLAWQRLLPIVGGSIYYKTDPLVERFLASFAPAGHLSLFHLASQFYAAGNQVVTKALINPVVPELARSASSSRWQHFSHLSQRRMITVLTVTGAAYAALIIVGRPLAQLLLDDEQGTSPEVDLLYALLVALIGVWLGGAAGQVSTSSFFAYGNTVTPTRVGVVGFTLGIPLKALLFWQWGVVGLAVGTSLYTLGNAAAHQLLLRRELRTFLARAPGINS